MAKLQQIVIKTESGGFEYLDVHSFKESLDMVTYGSAYDEAVSGALRSNMRGYRRSYEISYNKCLQPAQFLSVLNNIAADFDAGYSFIEAGETITNMFKFVVSQDTLHRIAYANSIGRYVPKIKLESFSLASVSIDGNFNTGVTTIDWRYVSEAVDQPTVDYNLITQTDTLQEDYGSIS